MHIYLRIFVHCVGEGELSIASAFCGCVGVKLVATTGVQSILLLRAFR